MNRIATLSARTATLLAVATLAGCDTPAAAPAAPTLTGLVNATEIDIAGKVPGRIDQVSVREGDRVEAGALLVRIKSEELDAKKAQAEAVISAAQARLALARKGARPQEKRALKSAVAAARHQVDITKKMVDRMTQLADERVVPEARYDEASFRHDVAVDQLTIARAKLDAVEDGARDEEIAALEALVRQAEGALAEVAAYKKETEQRAPTAGLVSKVYLHAGELAATGAPILTVVDLDDIWASFAVREDLLRDLRVGDRVTAEVPALGKEIPMEIAHLAAMGDFATWRATSDRDRFDLATFEVRLRPVAPLPELRPGMSVRWSLAAPPAGPQTTQL
ncbi:MAG: HlyD family efflux transporter periplasmic adaptor subunit [Deltaproteobacteria bacterium]|nr:MAG: HlyD family efflux transporter periplasmic adaptor subunit [Deltaproteobacteria bacterium]